MITCRLRCAKLQLRGFTLVELLVVIGIISILAGVALGPITRGITLAKESGSMQVTRQIGLACFAYFNDNNQVFPYAAKSELVVDLLLNGKNVSDPSIFYVAGTGNGASQTSGLSSPYSLPATACNFDFMVGSNGGLQARAADGTPIVQMTGGTMSMETTGPINCVIDASIAAYGTDGIAVCYKNMAAKFARGTTSGPSTAVIVDFVDASYSDPNGEMYSLTRP